MKRIILISLIFLSFSAELLSQNVGKLKMENARMSKSGDFMAVMMDVQMDALEVRNGKAFLLTPAIMKGDSLIALQSVGVYSYNRWFYYKRNGDSMISGRGEMSYRDDAAPERLSYETVVPYHDWMDGAELSVTLKEYGCCNKVLNMWDALLARYDGPYYPRPVYVAPEVETHKYRQISGSAFVDFPVSETVIYPEYHDNTKELAKIRASLDEVSGDADVTIKSMSIKGFASPESPYQNNVMLASGRTEALKKYVHDLCHIPNDLIVTDFEAENWKGLRAYVDSSDLDHKYEILAIIDSDREPDNKEWKIKSTYKKEYDFLLKNCYPSLRRSDYRIEYEVKHYTDPDEIAKVIYVKPQNLSLDEYYAYAQTLEVDSEEFVDVFDIAVRMYPEDKIANLNAANTAMARKEMKKAARYLEKAGDSPEADYAKGLYEYLKGNHDKALSLFTNAYLRGLEEASVPMAKIKEQKELNSKYNNN